jgi:tetrathionate reductase subunit B
MLAPGIRLIEVATAATPAVREGRHPAVRWGLLIDTTKCAEGCTDCVTACHTENGLGTPQRSTDAQWIRKIEIKEVKTGRQASVPVMCQHCAEPPCVDVCPTGASFKRADGIVLVDRHSCIGCRYCMMACPYKARSFVHEPLPTRSPTCRAARAASRAARCACTASTAATRPPACAEACTKAGHGAILFGDLNDPAARSRAACARSAPRSCAPTWGSTPACATRACEPMRSAADTRNYWLLGGRRAGRGWSRRWACGPRTRWKNTAT